MGICLSNPRQSVGVDRREASTCFDSLQQLSSILNERIQAEKCGLDCPNGETGEASAATEFGDEECTVVCDGKEYSMKIKSLCDNSPYFTAMFNCCMKEAHSRRIELQDVDSETLEIILGFISHSTLPPVDDVDQLLAILSLANMFLMASLYERCCSLARGLMNVQNYQEFWDVSRLHEAELLLKMVIDFMAEHFVEVKAEVKRFLELDEMPMLLSDLKCYPCIATTEDVADFISGWIDEDSDEREQFRNALCFYSDLNQIELRDLQEILERKDLYPDLIINTLLEKFTLQRLKVFLMNRYNAVWFYSVHEDKLLRLFVRADRSKIECICGSVDDYVFVFQYSITYGPVQSRPLILNVLKCHIYTGSILQLAPLENFVGNLHAVVNNEILYVIFISTNAGSIDHYVFQYYDPSLQQWISVDMKCKFTTVSFFVSVDDSVYVFGQDVKGHDVIERYKTATSQWQFVKYPPRKKNEREENVTCCLDELYLIRYPEVVDTIQWNLGSPKPSRVQKYENDGKFCVRYISYCSQTDCEIVSRDTRFLKFDGDKWVEIKATGGPDGIAQVLKGPHDQCIRVPYIYVVGEDNGLHQFDPRTCSWKLLYELPRPFRLHRGHSDFPPLSCISY